MRLSRARQGTAVTGRIMKPVEFENGTVQVDAAIIAEGFGITLPMLRKICKPAASQALRAPHRCGPRPPSPDILLRASAASPCRRRRRRDRAALDTQFLQRAALRVDAAPNSTLDCCRKSSIGPCYKSSVWAIPSAQAPPLSNANSQVMTPPNSID